MTPYYSDAAVTLFLGDCREIIPTLTYDLVVTDPPYGIGWRRGAGTGGSARAHAGILNDESTAARDGALRLTDGRPAMVFGSFYAPAPLMSGSGSSGTRATRRASSGQPRASGGTLSRSTSAVDGRSAALSGHRSFVALGGRGTTNLGQQGIRTRSPSI